MGCYRHTLVTVVELCGGCYVLETVQKCQFFHRKDSKSLTYVGEPRKIAVSETNEGKKEEGLRNGGNGNMVLLLVERGERGQNPV